MGFRLGNLTIAAVEEKHKFILSDAERETLESMRQNDAQEIENGKFHVFDEPMTMFVCDSYDTRAEVIKILSKYNSDIKGQLGVGFQEG
ncbi:hypothetical protein [Oceanobacillus jeddahense]|uniref:hypothetical protein n=1 Tax=Oceanobacillus jeddahense TaxID=1462527 RepID=UPI0005958640|nr:hypothetical protein [Oceanobacillus jeddahense]